MTHEDTQSRGNSPRDDAQKKITWKDSDIRTLYPKLFYVTPSREEITLLFGTGREAPIGQKEAIAEIQGRIVLSPFVAKRFTLSLGEDIRNYESRYGPIENNPQVPSGTPLNPKIGERPSPGAREKAQESAKQLFKLVKELKTVIGFERSFKMLRGTLLQNRFLLGVSKKALGEKAHEKILEICGRMDMPDEFLRLLKSHLPDADYIHFGFEDNQKNQIYKVYLEFFDKTTKNVPALPALTADHFRLHLGMKWDLLDPSRRVMTSYTWFPSISCEEIEERISGILDHRKHGESLQVAKAILRLASRRISHRDILYLDVTERGNPRKSFDINMYRANLELSEVYPFLMDLCRHYAVPTEFFHKLYEPVKSQTLGHISGGTDREGRDFLTVYYGVEGIQGRAVTSVLSAPGTRTETREKNEPLPPKNPPFVGVEKKDERAAPLFQFVNELNVQVGFERSFKVFRKSLLADRFLLGFRREDLGQGALESIMNICRRIDMPDEFLAAFEKHLPESNIVLFGFEGNEERSLYKAYLEFGPRFAEVIQQEPVSPKPFRIHMAFKWDASDNSIKTAADYICYPAFTLQNILERLAGEFYSAGLRKTPHNIVENLIRLAAERTDPNHFLYYEVREQENPRSSFDINMYSADLRIKELYPLLMDMVEHYSIPDDTFHGLYEAVGPLIFGHLSGGIDRQGRDFLTLYFGVKGSSGLRASRQ